MVSKAKGRVEPLPQNFFPEKILALSVTSMHSKVKAKGLFY